MQVFLPYPDFAQSARCLDNKRLGCQRKEAKQILEILATGPFQKLVHFESKSGLKIPEWQSCTEQEFKTLQKREKRKTPWYNHPAVKMWRGFEPALAIYGFETCLAWRERGFKDNLLNTFKYITLPRTELPPWLGNEAFHAAHRSNLLRKDHAWYSQFGWTEPDNLPYVWPV